MGGLQDRVIIITGAASGIGLATAKAALKEGANVLGVDVVAEPPASLSEINAGSDTDCHFSYHACDLTKATSPAEVLATCRSTFGGRIDVLFNIAGVMDHHGSVDTVTDSDWEKCMAINVTAPVKLMREVIPAMRDQQQGVIVNMASRAGLSGAAAGVAYTASKHAIIGVTKNVAWRFRDENIRCIAVCPGGVGDTAIVSSVDPGSFDKEAMAKTMPIINAVYRQRNENFKAMMPEELAETLMFLVGEGCSRITGAVIPIDDGWSTI
nr:short-chain dehydrogenase/reductase BrvG [Penicillium bialowiezense]